MEPFPNYHLLLTTIATLTTAAVGITKDLHSLIPIKQAAEYEVMVLPSYLQLFHAQANHQVHRS